ncbi:disease resistance protein RUN1-like isoform X2 [Eucalyptus grandis]|uniref:disease resistance protein RUN1-like isoform X2 n=1 Tax=Eucalyptus grandis TaxID=71139 RepID=UPI00192EC9E3|nr:disease resistance protein RUN1-like isoform X2 [Eucalyptus grandis]
MISIRALNDNEQRIFLDVACIFIGYDKRIVIHMWESCDYNPHLSLGVLQQRSLIKIREDNRLWMHDLLRDIGRNIIQQGSGMKPEKQQWVWTHDQALDILEKMQSGGGVHGIGSIEAMCLELTELSRYSLLKEFLESLSNLRFLQMDFKLSPQPSSWFMFYLVSDYIKNISRSNLLECLSGLLFLPESGLILQKLRWLSWNNFPYTFELSYISMRKLVVLDFSGSKIWETWYGWSHIKVAKNLKVLNLTRCNFRKTPDLSYHKELQQLILEGCELLAEIDSSIGHLKKLVFLNLKDCKSLQKLPDEMGALESLTELLLDYSTSIKEIPEWRRMKNLKILSLVGCTSLNKFSFIGCSTSAIELSLVDNHFNSLIELDLSSTAIGVLPDSIGYMKKLKVLKLCQCPLRKIPSAIKMLEKLEQLEAGGVGRPELEEIHSDIGKLPNLKKLVFVDNEIPAIPQLPESLITLTIESFLLNKMPDVSNLLNLRNLNLNISFKHPFKLDADPSSWGIERLRMLEVLNLKCSDISTSSFDLFLLSELKELQFQCRNLQCLPRLPMNLSSLRIRYCNRIKTTNDISHLKALSRLEIRGCKELTEIEGLEGLENLRTLDLCLLPSVKLPDLTSLKKLKLKKIYLCSFHSLIEIPDYPNLLETPETGFCRRLEKPFRSIELQESRSFSSHESSLQKTY